MSRGHGQLRQSQVITTYGPGALLDLPEHTAIVAGLETWPNTGDLDEIVDERLAGLLGAITGVPSPRMYAPPPEPQDPWSPGLGIGAWSFPEWFVVQDDDGDPERKRSRRLVHRRALDDGRRRFDSKAVVPTRFVRACPKGHVDDLDWSGFAHRGGERCRRQLWLDERGTTGDLAELVVRCDCGKSRRLYEATEFEHRPLGNCRGKRPWLGLDTDEACDQPSRLLIRTASNAYFAQVVSALSLPDRGAAVEHTVRELWDDLQIVDDPGDLQFIKKKPKVTERLSPFSDDEVLAAIGQLKRGGTGDRPVKVAELEALLAAPEGYGDDVPLDPDFHARRLPDIAWRRDGSLLSSGVESVVQLHRLREVQALVGFTRFEAAMRNIHGEYDTDVERADIAVEPRWFPAVENRGEGVFVHLSQAAVGAWLKRRQVVQRLDRLHQQHDAWQQERRRQRPFPGGPYILLHTVAHLLIQSMSMRCGYPASSIRERVYVEDGHHGLLLYTGTPDAEGTLGGLVQQARHIEDHLVNALEMALLCSNDPICAQHAAGDGMEQRFLHGAACHGCALIAETSCEMRNDYLDRALVVPVLGVPDAAFFPAP
ncbi:MAG: DUF1998 domain-containing protein [Acidimicrobiaceae bacterium]|nr:DUF1998 domain-containing protein [Acidimicrobiaceae bacterium]MYH77906.1 DUF1998 domain-containing protein [Acidimicrobiaceae bacterium]